MENVKTTLEKINIGWKLPDGFRTSSLLEEHEQGAVDVMNAYYRWMNGGTFTTLQEMQTEWNEPEFNRDIDVKVILSPEGKVVGYMDWWDVNALHVRGFAWLSVDPDYLGQGIEDWLVEWALERGRQNINRAPEGSRVVLHAGTNANSPAICELYERHGFETARHSYRMQIDFDLPPVAPSIPAGIAIRPMIPGKEEQAAIYAAYEAFQDHWGFVEEPFDKFLERWMYHLETDPYYDPSLYFLAMDGDEVAGVSLCYPRIEEAPDMAWVGTLGVRRPWRKRGLGLALLQHSFEQFYQRGKRRAGLGVDAENLTGALRLYEKAGMRIWRKNRTYEFELRSGKDLMTQKLNGSSA